MNRSHPAPKAESQPERAVSSASRAETNTPILALGQVGFLEVKDEVDFGVFVDNGLAKELLVPFAEQTCEMRRGQRYALGVLEDRQGRLIGTQRVAEMLRAIPPYQVDDWVKGEAFRREPKLGVFVIVEKQYLGLLPESEPHELTRGMSASFRVSQVLPDGKIQLSLRRQVKDEMEADADRVLERLVRAYVRVSDATEPEVIRALFGLSKKAYKRAVGRLIKRGRVRLDAEGYVVLVP
jgi:predicted RNA-binding protein (virulence factor B family)